MTYNREELLARIAALMARRLKARMGAGGTHRMEPDMTRPHLMSDIRKPTDISTDNNRLSQETPE